MTHRLALPGERYAFKRIKSDAAAARREFSISFEWFAEVCHKPCHYCGRIDINKISVKSRGANAGYIVKDFRYNGIDRINNSIGYTPENCVPCCVVCNRGKNSMGLVEWIAYLDTLVEFRTRRYDDGYQGRHVRAVSLPVSGGDSQAGNETKAKFARGGYVPSGGNIKRTVQDGCIIPKKNFLRPTELSAIHPQEEEPEQET